jgi:hypothetical protein
VMDDGAGRAVVLCCAGVGRGDVVDRSIFLVMVVAGSRAGTWTRRWPVWTTD